MTNKDQNAFRTLLFMRMEIYSHLARCFFGVFDAGRMRDEVKTLVTYVEMLGNTGEDLKKAAETYLLEVWKLSDLESLEFEYNRLFVGPARLIAPPYESVYTTEEALVMGEVTVEVRAMYRKAGLEMRNLHREPDDHIAIELDFLGALQERCLETLEENDEMKLNENIGLQRDFLKLHPGAWTPAFCKAIRDGSRSDYFRTLAELLERFIEADIAVLDRFEAVVVDKFE